MWAIADGSCLKTFEGHTSSVLRASFLTRGSQFVSCGNAVYAALVFLLNFKCLWSYFKSTWINIFRCWWFGKAMDSQNKWMHCYIWSTRGQGDESFFLSEPVVSN